MRKPKLRELAEAIRVLFKEGPYTSTFPKELTVPPESFRGKPVFDPDVCIGCGACSEVCPSRAIEVVDDTMARMRTIVLHYDICNFCGQCHLNCTTRDGVDYSSEYDLAAFDRESMVETVEKELAVCEICGEPAGTLDHLAWIAERLGSLAYSNPTLILANMSKLAQPIDVAQRADDRVVQREDLFRILCPSCRRRAYMTEEWG